MAIFEALLPVLLNLFGRWLKSKDASDELLKKYEALVEGAAQEGLLSEEAKTIYAKQKADVQAQLDADAAKKV